VEGGGAVRRCWEVREEIVFWCVSTGWEISREGGQERVVGVEVRGKRRWWRGYGTWEGEGKGVLWVSVAG